MTPTSTSQYLSRSSGDVSEFGEIGAHSDSSGSGEVDLERGEVEVKVQDKNNEKKRRACRICHLGLVDNIENSNNSNSTNGVGVGVGVGGGGGGGEGIELGCSCKGDLGFAHKRCAETWFKIKGNTVCEICGATAVNIAGEQSNEVHAATATAAAVSSAPIAPVILVEHRTFWHSRRVMNFLLACMVLAFVISWLFHFKVLS